MVSLTNSELQSTLSPSEQLKLNKLTKNSGDISRTNVYNSQLAYTEFDFTDHKSRIEYIERRFIELQNLQHNFTSVEHYLGRRVKELQPELKALLVEEHKIEQIYANLMAFIRKVKKENPALKMHTLFINKDWSIQKKCERLKTYIEQVINDNPNFEFTGDGSYADFKATEKLNLRKYASLNERLAKMKKGDDSHLFDLAKDESYRILKGYLDESTKVDRAQIDLLYELETKDPEEIEAYQKIKRLKQQSDEAVEAENSVRFFRNLFEEDDTKEEYLDLTFDDSFERFKKKCFENAITPIYQNLIILRVLFNRVVMLAGNELADAYIVRVHQYEQYNKSLSMFDEKIKASKQFLDLDTDISRTPAQLLGHVMKMIRAFDALEKDREAEVKDIKAKQTVDLGCGFGNTEQYGLNKSRS